MDPDATLVALLITFADMPAPCDHRLMRESCDHCAERSHARELMGSLSTWLLMRGVPPAVTRDQLSFTIGRTA